MTEHVPVLLSEVLSFLRLHPSLDRVLDCTLGLGGYSGAILGEFPDTRVIGIDRDTDAIAIAKRNLSRYGYRFTPLLGNFEHLGEVAEDFAPFDAILFDLGVSNLQISEGGRGFSFQTEGPLDMRMDPGGGLSAADIVNEFSEKEMTEIFFTYGEERFSRQIARGLVRIREKDGPFSTTTSLVEAIRKILPAPVQRKMGGHPARRVFQALRIRVNEELSALTGGLRKARAAASPGGLIAVVSYHSLEDRIVKHTFRDWQKEDFGKVLTRRPLLPSEEEVEKNYKARSAKLRVFSVEK
ncbi:16S rRNA (cytosine(1402)-N(4))-methyltransferase RsmH [Aminivibrio sp.]